MAPSRPYDLSIDGRHQVDKGIFNRLGGYQQVLDGKVIRARVEKAS